MPGLLVTSKSFSRLNFECSCQVIYYGLEWTVSRIRRFLGFFISFECLPSQDSTEVSLKNEIRNYLVCVFESCFLDRNHSVSAKSIQLTWRSQVNTSLYDYYIQHFTFKPKLFNSLSVNGMDFGPQSSLFSIAKSPPLVPAESRMVFGKRMIVKYSNPVYV